MYTKVRDVSLMRKFNRELMGNIITQQCALYQFKLEETKVNIYGESAEERHRRRSFTYCRRESRHGQRVGEIQRKMPTLLSNLRRQDFSFMISFFGNK